MWSSIENLKENLNKIALDVHDEDDEELEIYNSPARNGNHAADRRTSNRFAHSSPASRSPLANGFDSPYKSEIEQYKAEIKRLKESEAEIKALSMNYAALLKEKEDQILKLNGENSALNALRNESFKASTSSLNGPKGNSDMSPSRQHKSKSRVMGSPTNNGFVSKQDGLANGFPQLDTSQSKDLADLLEEKNRYLAAIEADHELQIKKVGLDLEKEREKLAKIQVQLQGEQKLNKSFQEELNLLKKNENKITTEMNQMRDVLNEKSTEVRRLQTMLNRTENCGKDNNMDLLARSIAALEKENTSLKMEKVELEAALKSVRTSSTPNISHDGGENSDKQSSNSNEKIDPLRSSPGREDMELALHKLEKELKEALQQKDKALQQLNRLKQHLLDKESEESEKMDEDSKVIEQLREISEYQRLQIVHLEKALKQAIASQDEVKMSKSSEFQKYKETIDDLNKKLTSCTRTIDAKNVELLNLQTALGQYYAEIEAKEHLEGDLARAREDSAKLSELLKDAHNQAELLRREKEDIMGKLSQTERTLAESRGRVNKLEEDNSKLRRALEQSMSRLNRMSMDSDYFVDRRIVIKLLVTYFQRNHSKEVLDLMVRMLGFSDEEKKRIGAAQQGAGKGVVRGVLGIPGRLVGGILGGGGSAEPNTNMASDNQSFADLWVDFLLTETEARERRESEEATGASAGNQKPASPNPIGPASPVPAVSPPVSRLNPSFSQYSSPVSSRGSILQSEHSDSEFSTVPLNSSERTSQATRPFPRY